VPVVVDPASARHLQGSLIDYCENPGESGFRISHPNPPSACDCGKSFKV
jgi:iron-sulfur cluster assembly accessory protein